MTRVQSMAMIPLLDLVNTSFLVLAQLQASCQPPPPPGGAQAQTPGVASGSLGPPIPSRTHLLQWGGNTPMTDPNGIGARRTGAPPTSRDASSPPWPTAVTLGLGALSASAVKKWRSWPDWVTPGWPQRDLLGPAGGADAPRAREQAKGGRRPWPLGSGLLDCPVS